MGVIPGNKPFEISFKAPLLAFLDLNGLWEAFVVLRCECCTVVEGMLPLPPALNRKGMEATMDGLEKVKLFSNSRVKYSLALQ